MNMKFRHPSTLASRRYIFGTANLTASLEQIVTYVGYYVDKALSDAQIIGLPITLGNFKDGIMETAHKQNKKNYCSLEDEMVQFQSRSIKNK